MKRPKQIIIGFRTNAEQAAKLAGIADRAGVNTSELLRLLVDDVQDVQPRGWSIVRATGGRESVGAMK